MLTFKTICLKIAPIKNVSKISLSLNYYDDTILTGTTNILLTFKIHSKDKHILILESSHNQILTYYFYINLYY